MDFLQLVENTIEQKRLLEEATEYELSKEVFELYAVLFENLSDAMFDTTNKANLDGNGKVSGDLRKAEVTIKAIKDILKTISGSKDKEKLDPKIKKTIGEIANSLKAIKGRFEDDILPTFEALYKVPEEENPIFVDGEEKD
jgi:hypothetical protein